MTDSERYKSFRDFYPYYLAEHSNAVCRSLHYVGSLCALMFTIYALTSGRYWFLLAGVLSGYTLAWVGHFFFEHNRPATFKYPLWSFLGDWVMLKDFLTGRLR